MLRKGIICCVLWKSFFKESRAGLLTVVWQMTCQRSHICWCASCWLHVFVLLVQFALVQLKIQFCLASSETGVAFLLEDYLIHQFAWVFLFSWDRCLRVSFSLFIVDFVRYLKFWHDMIKKYRRSGKKSVDYFVCSICCYGIHQALFTANPIAFHIVQLLCFCEKDNLCNLLDSSRKISYWSKLTMRSPWVQPWVRGGARAPFPNSGW